MAWWSRISSAESLFIVAIDHAFSEAESVYREAARHLERGASFSLEAEAQLQTALLQGTKDVEATDAEFRQFGA